MTGREPIRILCCDILKKELLYLAKKNRWNLETAFLASNLHVSLSRLENALMRAVERPQPPSCMMYGACHPLIDKICADHQVVRTPVQNCVEMLLGEPGFTRELQSGAFFLLEQWAYRWNVIADEVFVGSPSSRYEILKEEHDRILCLRTPCSTDFRKEAEAVGAQTGLPLQWKDISLDHMEQVLRRTFEHITSSR